MRLGRLFQPALGQAQGGRLAAHKFLRAPASHAMLQLTWAGDMAFASDDSLAPTARLFGYTGGLITCAQRTAMSQADTIFCDLFVRLSQGGPPQSQKKTPSRSRRAGAIRNGPTAWSRCPKRVPRRPWTSSACSNTREQLLATFQGQGADGSVVDAGAAGAVPRRDEPG